MTISLSLQATPFVGREDDIATLTPLLTARRLVTLVGAGGIGKTRLALRVASQVAPAFTDGMHVLEFASLSDPTQVLPLAAATLGVREQPEVSLLQTLIDRLRSRQSLLVFDNCEHVIASCAALARSLLQHCPRLHLLVTSREGLRLNGEILWQVRTLACPPTSESFPLERLLAYEAVELFCARALVARPSFSPTRAHMSILARICHRLDGIPLALELAAAQLSTLSLDQLAASIAAGFSILAAEYGAEARHHTLQNTFDWGYRLLSPLEQRFLARASVFTSGWTLEAAEDICADEQMSRFEIPTLLIQLQQKSWLVAEDNTGETALRYRLLETIRQYAHQHLLADEDTQQFYAQHWQWYLGFIESATHGLYGAAQAQWFDRVECELDNLRLALERSLAAREVETTARIAAALGPFWVRRGRLSEGRSWYDTLLALPDLSVLLRLSLLHHAAEILRFQGDYARMRSLLQERLSLLKHVDTSGASSELAATYCSLGWAAFYQGDWDAAITDCTQGLRLFQAAGDQPGIARCLSGLALVAMLQQKYSQAKKLLQEVISIRRQLSDHAELLFALNAQVRVAVLQGERALALAACEEALQLVSGLQQPFGIIYCLEALAALTGAWGSTMQAVQLFGAAHGLRATIGIPIPPSLRALREQELLPLHTQLGEHMFEEQWTRGLALSLNQARSQALEAFRELQTRFGAVPDAPVRLSQREMDVLRLVANGLSDAQVAQELVLSTRTVSTHLRSIYRKLEVNSRSAAIRFAVEQGLLS